MKRIAELRKECNMSQSRLAEELHTSQQAICRYELGQSEPDIYTLKGMADIFHTSVDYLIEYNSGNYDSEGYDVYIDHQAVSRQEIEHLIAYRKLNIIQREHIDSLINDIMGKSDSPED